MTKQQPVRSDAEGAPIEEMATARRRQGLPVRETPVRAARRRSPRTGATDAGATGAIDEGRPEDREAERQALELGRRIVDLAADKKAADIVLLEVRELTTLTDYFVICSGGSERQLGAIADGIAETLKAEGTRAIGREGGSSAHWLLLDYGSVIVHIMATPEREYYALEKLWSEAPLRLRVQ